MQDFSQDSGSGQLQDLRGNRNNAHNKSVDNKLNNLALSEFSGNKIFGQRNILKEQASHEPSIDELSRDILNYNLPLEQTRAAAQIIEMTRTNHPEMASGVNKVANALSRVLEHAVDQSSISPKPDEYTLYGSVLAAKAIGENKELVHLLDPAEKMKLFAALANLFELREQYPLVKLAEKAAINLDPYLDNAH